MGIYDALLQGDPEYQLGIAPIRQRRSDLVTQFGSGAGVAGIDPSVAAAAAANPYSISQQLLHQYRGNLSGVGMDFNSRGGLFSGAYRHAVANAGDQARQAQSDAYGQFQQGLGGLQGDENALNWSVYNRLAQNPPGIGTQPAAVGAPPPPAPGMAAALTSPLGTGSMAGADILKPLRPRLPTPPQRSVWSGSGL